jgi:uncharacterized protein (TIGR02058 family)
MERKRYIVELGTGVDMHGGDATEAACRAVKAAMHSCCLVGLTEILTPEQMQSIQVEIQIAIPFPDAVDQDRLKSLTPVGEKIVSVVKGGMTARGVKMPGSEGDEILVANAALTVSVAT